MTLPGRTLCFERSKIASSRIVPPEYQLQTGIGPLKFERLLDRVAARLHAGRVSALHVVLRLILLRLLLFFCLLLGLFLLVVSNYRAANRANSSSFTSISGDRANGRPSSCASGSALGCGALPSITGLLPLLLAS